MHYLEPHRVETKDLLSWFKESFELIGRRWLTYIISVLLFFLIVYFAGHSVNSFGEQGSPIVLVSILVFFTAFIFFFVLSNLVLLSHWSDQSQSYSIHSLFEAFLPSQKIFFKMAVITVCSGLFFWYLSILLHPEKNLLSSSISIIHMLDNRASSLQFVLSTSAIFLYFSLLMMFISRTFFSVPLILFHQLNYLEAQHLSKMAFMKNFKVMINVLAIWVCIFLLSIKLAPVLAVLFLPLFGAFMYVSFRQIFWGQEYNEKQKEVTHNIISTRAV